MHDINFEENKKYNYSCNINVIEQKRNFADILPNLKHLVDISLYSKF